MESDFFTFEPMSLLTCVLYVLVAAAVAPYIIRRVIVELFNDPEVKRLHVLPTKMAMDANFCTMFAPGILSLRKNEKAKEAIKDLLMCEPMQKGWSDDCVDVMNMPEIIESHIAMMNKLNRDENVVEALMKICLDVQRDDVTQKATKNIMREAVTDKMVLDELLNKILILPTQTPSPRSLASNDEGWKGAKNAIKEAVIGIARDEDIHDAAVKAALFIARETAKASLKDNEIVDAMKDFFKDAIGDGSIHKANMHGLFESIKPKLLKSSDSNHVVRTMENKVNSIKRDTTKIWGDLTDNITSYFGGDSSPVSSMDRRRSETDPGFIESRSKITEEEQESPHSLGTSVGGKSVATMRSTVTFHWHEELPTMQRHEPINWEKHHPVELKSDSEPIVPSFMEEEYKTLSTKNGASGSNTSPPGTRKDFPDRDSISSCPLQAIDRIYSGLITEEGEMPQTETEDEDESLSK